MATIHENAGNTEYWMLHALRTIEKLYGHAVSPYAKGEDLLSFGRNELVGTTKATLAHQPTGIVHETYVASNLINSIISTSTADGESVLVEGHTILGGVFTRVTQTITLNGRTKVALTTALARVDQVHNDSATELAGVVSVTETDTYTNGVPDTAALVHLQIGAGEQHSEKCATTTSDGEYWILQGFHGDTLEKTASFAEIHFECRLKGKVFIDLLMKGTTNGYGAVHNFNPYMIVPPNSDIRLAAIADGASTDISGAMHGVLASIIS